MEYRTVTGRWSTTWIVLAVVPFTAALAQDFPRNYAELNCTSDHLGAIGGSDEINRCRCSALVTRLRPECSGWLLKGTDTGTMEIITPKTAPSSSITGLPLCPGTAKADTKKGVEPQSPARTIHGFKDRSHHRMDTLRKNLSSFVPLLLGAESVTS